MRIIFSFPLLAALATGLQAQDWPEGYADHARLTQRVQALGRTPHATASSLGQTLGGRDIWLLTLGAGERDKKPAILIVGSTHAPHALGSELAIALAEKLSGDDAAALRDRFTFYIIPRPNPDASEAVFVKPHADRTGNDRPTDDDRDGAVNEDGPEDLDVDGFITQMRIAEPTGNMMPHPDDPRILIPADIAKQERGVYRLLTEGIDNDHDEAFNEDGPGGVDFNRNFTFDYPFFSAGAGPHQVSEVESRAVADFCFSRTNIALVLSFGVNDNLVQPWKPDPQAEKQPVKTSLLADDAPYFDFVVETYKGLRSSDNAPNSSDGRGAFVKWAYFHYGRWAFEARAWWVPKLEAPKTETIPEGAKPEGKVPDSKPETRGAEQVNSLKWFEQQKVAAFSEWKEIKHPDFPDQKVEVGGFRPLRVLNPTAAMIPDLAETHFKFIDKLATLMPRIEVGEFKVESLGGGVYRVTASVVNEGYLPTVSAMGKLNRLPIPLNLTLAVPADTAWLSGSPRSQIDSLAGQGGRAEVTWLIRAQPGEIELTVASPSVGRASRKAQLP